MLVKSKHLQILQNHSDLKKMFGSKRLTSCIVKTDEAVLWIIETRSIRCGYINKHKC